MLGSLSRLGRIWSRGMKIFIGGFSRVWVFHVNLVSILSCCLICFISLAYLFNARRKTLTTGIRVKLGLVSREECMQVHVQKSGHLEEPLCACESQRPPREVA